MLDYVKIKYQVIICTELLSGREELDRALLGVRGVSEGPPGDGDGIARNVDDLVLADLEEGAQEGAVESTALGDGLLRVHGVGETLFLYLRQIRLWRIC